MFSYSLTPACTSPHVQDPVRSWESDRRQIAAAVDTSDIYWKKYDGKLKVFILQSSTHQQKITV